MRLIDADELKKNWLFRGDDGKPYRDAVDEQPAIDPERIGELASNLHQSIKIDVTQVIRCKDCKWYEPVRSMCNNSYSLPWHPDDYCSDAERKEE